MKRISLLICLFILTSPALAFSWKDLWHTKDQQGMTLLQAGKAKEASQIFANPDWRAVSQYRAGDYTDAFKQFKNKNTSDAQYNAGNASAFMGQYEQAINSYDKALALNPDNKDAIFNREIVKKLLEKQNQQQSQNDKKDQQPQQQNADNKQNPQSTQQNADNQKKPDNQPRSPQQNQQQSQNANKDEEKQQLMRRVDENPGSLLQRKFLRDYVKRHGMAENPDQGDN